ncbi:uncharacterized protein LOC143211620 [Lasioglossum baleicum]|uniref:uncharacterized protein LOC143211620 n=1 Tax=Lasioglossum baleicum TaxID=434251 RepID=UPI003FCE63D4
MATINPNHIPKLGEKNYETWKIQVKSLLVYNELWTYTNGTEPKTAENQREWDKKDDKALALILLSVQENQLNHVKRANTSYEAWETLKRIFESKGPVRRAALYRELHRMKKGPDQTMTQYTNSFQNKLEQLEEVGPQNKAYRGGSEKNRKQQHHTRRNSPRQCHDVEEEIQQQILKGLETHK